MEPLLLKLKQLEDTYKKDNLSIARIYLYVRRKVDSLEWEMKQQHAKKRALLNIRQDIKHAADELFLMEEDVRRGKLHREDFVKAAIEVAEQQQVWHKEGRPQLTKVKEEVVKLRALKESWEAVLVNLVDVIDMNAYSFVQVQDSIIMHYRNPSRTRSYASVVDRGDRITFVYSDKRTGRLAKRIRAIFRKNGCLVHWCQPFMTYFSSCMCQALRSVKGYPGVNPTLWLPLFFILR